MSISDQERAERGEAVRQARQSSEMEGVVIDEVTRVDEDEYAAGLIDAEELIRRGFARLRVID